MQDIISTLKNALQQAEAGLEVAVGRLAKDGTERGDFKPSEVLALACVRDALAMPVICLHQIQEPEADIWPCVNIDVDESGKITNAKLYSPGLPAGNHDVYPVRVPYMDEHTEAWLACAAELRKHLPEFMHLRDMNGIECAVAAIRELAERSAPVQTAPAAVPVPDERAAFEKWWREWGLGGIDVQWEAWQARAALAATQAADGYTEMLEESFGITDPAAAPVVPSELIEAVDAWFAQNTGLCGCSDKDVAELAAIFAEATQVTLPEPVMFAIDCFDAYFRSANGVPPNARISVPTSEWQELRALLATATGLPAQAVADEVHCVCGASWLRHGVNNYEMTDTPRKAQADARDAEQERWMGIGKAIERACVDLPAGAEINIHLEKDAGTVTLSDCDGDEQENFPTDEGFAGVVNAAIDAAIAAAKGE